MTVSQIGPTTPNAYFMPGADPGEGYMATNDQLFGTETAPASSSDVPGMRGLRHGLRLHPRLAVEVDHGWSIVPGTVASNIMGCFTPQTLPVLSALATSYAVCDQWFASVPTETLPEPRVRLLGDQSGAHGRQDAHVHVPVDLRAARPQQHRVGDLRL